MSRVLLVDTNRAAYPIYKHLCNTGYDVWVVGNKPDETLAKLAPNYVYIDYSNITKLKAFITATGFDHIVPGCTDLSYEICSKLFDGQETHIDSWSNVFKINNKSEFRSVAKNNGIPVPKILTSLEAIGFPHVIVKPVDSFSGRGMSILHSPTLSQIQNALKTAAETSQTGSAIIEEFVSGQLFSYSAFICNHEVITDFVVQEDCVASPFAVDTSRVIFDFDEEIRSSLRDDLSRLSQDLQLSNGLIHTQFITKDSSYWVVEMTRRCPGDIYSLLIEYSTGYPYAANYAAPFIGEHICADHFDTKKMSYIIRHTATPARVQHLWGLSFSQPVDIKQFIPLATSGDKLGIGPLGRTGIFFFRNKSKEQQDYLYKSLLHKTLYTFN